MDSVTGASKGMKRGDKIAGVGVIVAALAALGAGLYFLLPILIELAENLIIFGVELVVAAWMLIVLLDKKTWLSMYYNSVDFQKRVHDVKARFRTLIPAS